MHAQECFLFQHDHLIVASFAQLLVVLLLSSSVSKLDTTFTSGTSLRRGSESTCWTRSLTNAIIYRLYQELWAWEYSTGKEVTNDDIRSFQVQCTIQHVANLWVSLCFSLSSLCLQTKQMIDIQYRKYLLLKYLVCTNLISMHGASHKNKIHVD